MGTSNNVVLVLQGRHFVEHPEGRKRCRLLRGLICFLRLLCLVRDTLLLFLQLLQNDTP